MHEDADPKDLPEDLRETADRLRDGRPSWTADELDGIKLRAMKHVAGVARSRWPLARLARSALFTPLVVGGALVALVALTIGGAVKSNVGPLTLVSCTQYGDCSDALVITSPALSGSKSSSATLGPIVVTLESGGVPVAPTANVLVTLTSNSSTGVFSSTNSGGATSSSLTVTIPAGSMTSAAYPAYYGDTTAGNPVITAAPITTPPESNTTVTSGTQTETIFGPATHLVFLPQPVGGVTEGTAFGTQPVVKVEDANGNVVTSYNSSVTLAIASTGGYTAGQGGTTEGTLGCPNSSGLTVTASNGSATFAGCEITGTAAAGSYKLTASGDSLSVTSNSVAIDAGNATQLAFTTQPADTTVATSSTAATLSTQPVVTAKDQYGNTAASDSTSPTLAVQSVSTGSGVTAGTLSGCSSSGSAGVFTYSGCEISNPGGYNYVLSAASTPLSPASSSMFSVSGTVTLSTAGAATLQWPLGLSSLSFTLNGAGGGSGGGSSTGAAGGQLTGTLTLGSGTSLSAFIGGAGVNQSSSTVTGTSGCPGGGAGGSDSSTGGGGSGGGATCLLNGSTPVAVAGGGGGGGELAGGAGSGGNQGTNGTTSGTTGGYGGETSPTFTQGPGGAAGNMGHAGSIGTTTAGGAGGSGANGSNGDTGGGGGGGYASGGGGGTTKNANSAGGGGGSGYSASSGSFTVSSPNSGSGSAAATAGSITVVGPGLGL